MIVEELIKILQELPPTAEVYYQYGENGYGDMTAEDVVLGWCCKDKDIFDQKNTGYTNMIPAVLIQ